MSILFRIFGWIGGIISSMFGTWLSDKIIDKTTASEEAEEGTREASDESKGGIGRAVKEAVVEDLTDRL